jgi:predicted nucleotidyltransferase component of viral defense system
MIDLHEDIPLFREAVRFTQAQTGFAARLIEKDYLCTVALAYLAESDPTLVFKGGTCLAKIHAGFYRMSEDLDFMVPIATDAPRSERSRHVATFREALQSLPGRLASIQVVQPPRGANNSTQYLAVLGYQSRMATQQETIQLEVGLREPLLTPCAQGSAHTLLLDPVSGRPIVEPIRVQCLSLKESFAEKYRAALSRRDVAIRDFYDLHYATTRLGLDPQDKEFVSLVRQKMAVPGNDLIGVNDDRVRTLERQLEPQLRSVLREQDFRGFDLAAASRLAVDMAARLR